MSNANVGIEMKIGPLELGWTPLTEEERVFLGLEPNLFGWEVFVFQCGSYGVFLACRKLRRKKM